jgi:prevent-host-death family protein
VKTVAVRDLQKKIRECVDLAQKEQIVITRRGRPAAIVIGVEGRDWEDVLLERSESFWKLIEARRKERTITLAEMRKRVRAPRARRRPKR